MSSDNESGKSPVVKTSPPEAVKENKTSAKRSDRNKGLPVLPLRDVVVFPHMVIPLFVGREHSIKALEHAIEDDKQILLVAQHNASDDEPTPEQIYDVGAVANILQMLKLPDGTVKVLVEGINRANVIRYIEEDFLTADVERQPEIEISGRESEVLMRAVNETFEQYVKLNAKIPSEVLTSVASIDDGSRMADTIAAHLNVKNEDKQTILSFIDPTDRSSWLRRAG